MACSDATAGSSACLLHAPIARTSAQVQTTVLPLMCMTFSWSEGDGDRFASRAKPGTGE
jgi:hypothetical protein